EPRGAPPEAAAAPQAAHQQSEARAGHGAREQLDPECKRAGEHERRRRPPHPRWLLMVLLHPVALFALALLVPLAGVEWVRVRRARSAAGAPGLRPPRLWRALRNGFCAGLVIALAAFAASEPSLGQTKRVQLRADAEVYVSVDSSASMLASASSHSPTRLQQA